jgi:membrane protein YdbS with pleckstrin-like domain
LTAAAGALVVVPLFYYAVLSGQAGDPTVFRRTLGASESVNLAVLFLVAALLLLWRWRRRADAWLPAAAVALLWLDLAVASAGFNPTGDDLLRGYRHEGVVQYLQARADDGRIDTRTGVADLLQPDLARLYGLEDVAGLFNPLTLRAFDSYWEGLGSRSVPGYDLLSVRYLVARPDVPLDAAKFRLVYQGDDGLAVFENAGALPRAFVVPRAEALAEADIAARLRDPGFDPRAAVLLDPGAPIATGGGAVERLERRGPNALEARLSGVRGGYLVLTNVLYPGWRATIDGREAPIQRAYGLFQAVQLPEGAAVVRFEFRPRRWEVGMASTLLIWALVALAGAALLRERTSAAASPGGGTNGRVAGVPRTAGEVAWR